MSHALIAINITVEVDLLNNGVYTEIGNVTDFNFPGIETDEVETTTLKSPGGVREYEGGLKTPGDGQMTLNWNPGDGTDLVIIGLHSARTKVNWRVTLPNGHIGVFRAFVKSYTPAMPLGDKMTLDATLKGSGPITWTAAAAPVNSLLPSIAGIAQVGQTLTAIEGLWSGGPTFTYQWQANGGSWSNISGATARTYVPIVGQVSQPVRCIVTGTNSAGNASATSGATAAVIAA
jgi:hypothetical protein